MVIVEEKQAQDVTVDLEILSVVAAWLIKSLSYSLISLLLEEAFLV